MNLSESLGPLAVALLCILALGLAAATLSSPVETSQESGGEKGVATDRNISSDSSGDSVSVGNVSAEEKQLANFTRNNGLCVEQAKAIPIWPTVFGISTLVGLLFLWRYGRLLGMASFLLTLLPAFLLITFMLLGCAHDGTLPTDSPDVNTSGNSLQSGEDEGEGDGAETKDETTLPITVTSMIVAFFVLATTVLLSFVLFRRRERTAAPGEEMEAPEATEPTKAVGAVAGEAADEIEAEGSDLENEVYRAWAEMAAALDVDHPDTSTPAEFAEAATEAGIRPDDVRELTSLFEQVRYGTVDATSDRERQAIDALRRIEDSYAVDSGEVSKADETDRSDETDRPDESDPTR